MPTEWDEFRAVMSACEKGAQREVGPGLLLGESMRRQQPDLSSSRDVEGHATPCPVLVWGEGPTCSVPPCIEGGRPSWQMVTPPLRYPGKVVTSYWHRECSAGVQPQV